MITMVHPQIVGIVCRHNTGGEAYGDIPVHELSPLRNLPTRILHRILPNTRPRPVNNFSKAIEASQPHVIFSNFRDFTLDLLPAALNARVPVICHVHGYDITPPPHPLDPTRREFDQRFLDRVKDASADVVFVCGSQYARKQLVRMGVDEDRIVLKYFGYRPEVSIRAAVDRGAKFLFLSRLVDCKGVLQTIAAFELACNRGLRGTLTIAGDGPQREAMHGAVQRSAYRQRINVVGPVDAMSALELRAAADVFTAHSNTGPTSGQTEMFGVAFLEAQGDGLPVVTGRSGGIPEIVVDGQTGILFEPGDIDEHANALLELAHNAELRLRMGLAARKRVEALFTPALEFEAMANAIDLAIKLHCSSPERNPTSLARAI
jgi:colanic acid/amylovoran biosynthesis glycosyltransferase